MRRVSLWVCCVLGLVLAAAGGSAAAPQVTALPMISYQGRLDVGGVPATGVFDLKVALFDAAEGGVGVTLNLDDVQVTDGLFTVTLDYGTAPFTGGDRWIQLAVRPGDSTGDYTVLASRQKLSWAPYAIRALKVPVVGVEGLGAGDGLRFHHGLFLIDANGVETAMLANDAVTADKLADGAVLARLLEEDGADSGVDADLLDGVHLSTLTDADTALQTAIDDEATRALAAEGDLQDAIDAVAADLATETTARATADTTLTDALADEVTRATTAETALQTALDTVAADLATETTNRTTAGDTLTDALADEVTRATGVEATLLTNINTRALKVTTISAGDGLLGGGDLSANRALSANFTPSGVGVNGTALTVARGDHGHDAATLTGTLATGNFSAYADLVAEGKIGTGAAQVAAGDHLHSSLTAPDGSPNPALSIDNSGAVLVGSVGTVAVEGNNLRISTTSAYPDFWPTYDQSNTLQMEVWYTWGNTAQSYWQSFTPGFSGSLARLEVCSYSNISDVTLRIYEGEGTGGTLLHTQAGITLTKNENMVDFFYDWITLSTPVPLVKGKVYTYELSAGSEFVLWSDIDDEDLYTRGRSSLDPGKDLLFRTVMTPREDAIVLDTGYVGIGRTPTTNALEVEGDASKTTPGDWLANSDRRLKTDIEPLTGNLDTIMRLTPVRYRYTEDYLTKHPTVKDHYYYNFIAQDYQQVFPDATRVDGDGYLMIDTHPAQITLIGAVQELNRKLEAKDAELARLRAEVERLKTLEARLATLERLLTKGK